MKEENSIRFSADLKAGERLATPMPVGRLRGGRMPAGATWNEERLYVQYQSLMEQAGGHPVAVWALGAEKPPLEGENPSLGCRGVRFCLQVPDRFQVQLRALLRAAQGQETALLISMVTRLEEVRAVREELRRAEESLGERYSADSCALGVIIDTPASALLSDLLAEAADFYLVDLDRLVGYTLAADPENPAMRALYRVDDPSVLAMARLAVRGGLRGGLRVGLCGKALLDKALFPALLGLGAQELVVPQNSVQDLQKRAEGLEESFCLRELERLLERQDRNGTGVFPSF